eukprot:UN28490
MKPVETKRRIGQLAKKDEFVRRKEIEGLLSLAPPLLVTLVVNVMKKWQPPDDLDQKMDGISPALQLMIKKLSAIKKSKKRKRKEDESGSLKPLRAGQVEKEEKINIMRGSYRRLLSSYVQKLVKMEGKGDFHTALVGK